MQICNQIIEVHLFIWSEQACYNKFVRKYKKTHTVKPLFHRHGTLFFNSSLVSKQTNSLLYAK